MSIAALSQQAHSISTVSRLVADSARVVTKAKMRWLGFLALASLLRARSPPLSISLETSWAAPPLALEILEVVHDENPSSYFPLLNLLIDPSKLEPSSSPRQILDTARELITTHDLLPQASSLATFNLALSLHTAVPRIEAAYVWYESEIDEKAVGVDTCGSWVEWRGKGFCGVEELANDVERSIEDSEHHFTNHSLLSLPFDRSFIPDSKSTSPQAILYIDWSSPSTGPLLHYLRAEALHDENFHFTVRYKPNASRQVGEAGSTVMSGYGVELALKKTDYLVVDDRAAPGTPSAADFLGSRAGDATSGEDVFDNQLGEAPWTELSTPLTTAEVSDISLKAASLIMESPDPLAALAELSQDWPKYSAAVARRVTVSPNVERNIPRLYQRGQVAPGVFVNGRAVPDGELNAYALLKTIREERDLILSLLDLGLTPKQAFELISDHLIGGAQVEDDPGEGFVDASDRIEGEGVITWWNDVEKDARYKQWPQHVQGYLRPVYPGQLHTVRRNTWNLVFVLDLSSAPSLDAISNSISMMVQRGLPIRFGIVPMVTDFADDTMSQMAKIFHYAVKHFGRALTNELLSQIVANTRGTAALPGVVKLDTVREAYESVAESRSKPSISFDELLSSSDFDDKLDSSSKYMKRLLATKEESATGHLFINGKHYPMTAQWTSFVQQELTGQLTFLQQQLAAGMELEDTSTFFYDLPSTTPRRSKFVLPGLDQNKLRVFNLANVFKIDPTKKLASDFVYHSEKSRGSPITLWAIGDLDSPEGRQLARDGLMHLQRAECASRLGFIHLPSTQRTSPIARFSDLLYRLLSESALHTVSPGELLALLDEFDKNGDNVDTDGTIFSDQAQKVLSKTAFAGLAGTGLTLTDTKAADVFWEAGSVITEQLGLRSQEPHLLINGRLIGPLTSDTFNVDDLEILELYELRKRTKPVIDLLQTMYDDITAFDRATLAHLISTTSSVIASAYKASSSDGIFTPDVISRNRFYEKLDDGSLSFTVGDKSTAVLNFAVVVDPVSEQAQKWSGLVKALAKMENIAVSVHLLPNPTVSELKLKRFYRFALSPELSFDVDGNEVRPEVVFSDLPTEPIYTLAMDTPPSWIVSPKTSPYDLDNLQLAHIHEALHVSFNLKQLLIEGHAREGNNAPPRGLQLQLTAKGLGVVSDTQVMANLGYFQFKSTPGVYNLNIRPGRGTEVYDLESVGTDGWDSLSVNVTGTAVSLMSFEGVTILPRFERRPGMELANVLMEEPRSGSSSYTGSVFTRMKEIVGLSTPPVVTPKAKHADINIFTVASGLLYERFASIMILSVMKNTQSSVKFWFIENFLSPTFLEFVPKMAEEYGFEYEFVTYKWPHWLRAQTEKQRIIWAYKILFLDVLFPMSLDKVIFVDADQIVRTDMKELVDVDLQGHVYGMAPMGDDRTEMEGFRFWKTGYWKEVLRGRPYHISALYVVDLKRFRQLATGDRLRGQYHALSADPNSLANLDQDLPNSMQDQIPIFTLDQDWLWCQTWCSDESLARAKTIDLCQNPMTKEPKLVRARQIPEWDTYDQEIAAFASRLAGGAGGSLAISVDDLAAEKKVVVEEEAVEAAETSDPEDVAVDDGRSHLDDEL